MILPHLQSILYGLPRLLYSVGNDCPLFSHMKTIWSPENHRISFPPFLNKKALPQLPNQENFGNLSDRTYVRCYHFITVLHHLSTQLSIFALKIKQDVKSYLLPYYISIVICSPKAQWVITQPWYRFSLLVSNAIEKFIL